VAVDYAVVDATSGWDGRTDLVQWAQERHPGARYEQLPDVGRYLIARRVR
jgi:hypothetical protein